MRIPLERASASVFAACYLSAGGYFALGGPASIPLRCLVAAAWPFVFGRYSPMGTLCMIGVFATVAGYVRALRYRQRLLRYHIASLAQREAQLGEQLELSGEETRRAARQRDEALRQLADRAALPVDATGLSLVKHSFARRFHPDHLRADDPERPVRTALFKEFWAEISRIEREAKGR